MAATLFGSTSPANNKNLVEFRAGKMTMKDKIVHPDKRKGMVYVHQADDSLMHFCWKDRSTGSVEEDLIIFPEDVEYKRVKECKTGRVFVLRFKSNNRRLFYWMQEPKTDKDDEFCRKINEYLNNPPTPGSRAGSSSLGGSDIGGHQSADLSNFIGNISQTQLMQLLGSGVPSLANLLNQSSGGSSGSGSRSSATAASSSNSSTSTTTTTSASANTATPGSSSSTSDSSSKVAGTIQESDLRKILSGMGAAAAKPQVELGTVMTAEALQPILSNPEFVEELKPYLPSTGETLPSLDILKGTVSSPQFQQAVNIFSAALQSGDLGPLISQFGLGDEAVAAATNSDMEAFVKALSKKQKEDKAGGSKKKDEDKDEDESMSTD